MLADFAAIRRSKMYVPWEAQTEGRPDTLEPDPEYRRGAEAHHMPT